MKISSGLEAAGDAESKKAADTFKAPGSYTVNRLNKIRYICIRTCSTFWGNFPEHSYLHYLKLRVTNCCFLYHQSRFLHVLSDDIKTSWNKISCSLCANPSWLLLCFKLLPLSQKFYFEEDRIISFHWRFWSISTSEAQGHLPFPISLSVNIPTLPCILKTSNTVPPSAEEEVTRIRNPLSSKIGIDVICN